MIKDPELLKLAVKAIEAEPKGWDQEFYAAGLPKEDAEVISVTYGYLEFQVMELDVNQCGTTMCLAGHIVHQAGLRIVTRNLEEDGRRSVAHCLDEDGNITTINRQASLLLGLDSVQASRLFGSMTDDIDEFKELITQVTGVTFE